MIQKTRLEDLALFGGLPSFPVALHVGRPNFGDPAAFMKRVDRILELRRFTNDGPCVREFEERVAAVTGARHCVATSNATTALQLAARALALEGRVVVPSFTFIATAHAFAWLGLEPTFCDVDAETHGMDPASARRACDEQCSALVAVHTWGIPCDVPALTDLAQSRRIPLIIDAAHAFACSLGTRPLGACGDATVYSFHATKFVHSFEGGALTTDSDGLAERLRLMRDFGFAGYDLVACLGTNAKMSELHAAAGLTTLEAMPDIISENRRCFDSYRSMIRNVPNLRILDVAARGVSNHQYIVAEIDPAGGIARDDLVRALHAEGILARRYFSPGCHRAPPYAARTPAPALPVTEALVDRVLVLPTGPSVSDDDILGIEGSLKLIFDRPRDFNAALSKLPSSGSHYSRGSNAPE